MKKYQRRRRRKTSHRKKLSHLTIVILVILGIVLLGDMVGAIMYVRQSPESKEALMHYFCDGASGHLSLFEIFWQQLMYQLTIWGLGLTIIGNVVNGFLLFARGVSAGFNLAFIIGASNDATSASILLLWSFQSLLILFTTILSVYFSIRFAYLVVKCIAKKKYQIVKKQLILYITQLGVVLVLTVFTSLVTAIVTPRITQALLTSEHLNVIQLEVVT
jgi:uncharacterized membrane protein SpoIIM required for sporulation